MRGYTVVGKLVLGLAAGLLSITVVGAASPRLGAREGVDSAAQESPDAAGNSSALIQGKVGYRVQLAGPGTSAANDSLNWNFVEEPPESRARILDSVTPDAYFVPDVQGVYVVRGTGGFDTVTETVTVGPGRTLIPVQVRHLQGENSRYNIVVDGVAYPGPPATTGAGTNVVLLNRATLQLIDHKTFTDIALKAYLQDVLRNSADVLAILSTNDRGPGFSVDQIAPELEQFGANSEFRQKTAFPFSLIGVKKSSSGQAYQAGYESLNLAGYFVPDASAKYAFLQTDFRVFEINPSQNLSTPSTVKIDGKTVLSSHTAGCADGGLLLGLLDRATLTPVFSQSYCTFASTPAASIAAQKELSVRLNAEARPNSPLAQAGPRRSLLFLVSFGRIHNGASPYAPDFARLAYSINFAGGTYEAIYNVDSNDTYSLVTSPDPAVMPWEAGSQIAGISSGRQEGVLARGRLGNWYAPMGATSVIPGGTVPNLGLYPILAHQPQSFPVPRQGDREEEIYFRYISQLLCGSSCLNVRPMYENTNIDLNIYYTKLVNQKKDPLQPSNPSCDSVPEPDTSYCVLRHQVLVELEYAGHVRMFAANVSSLWTAQNSNISSILTSVTESVNNALTPDPNRRVPEVVHTIVGGLLTAASVIPPPGGTVAGLVNGFFTVSVGIANNSLGNNAGFDVNVPAGQLARQTAVNFALQKTATGVMFNSIYEDWGKLQALGSALNSGDQKWAWNGDQTTGQILNEVFNRSTEKAFYQSLMSDLYVTRYYNARSPQELYPWDYRYMAAVTEHFVDIFSSKTPPVDYLSSPSPRTNNPQKSLGERDILTLSYPGGLPSGSATQYRTPKADLIQHLLDPIDNGGLGIWKPEIIRHWFPIYWCGPPGDKYQGNFFLHRGVSGCDYAKIQLPLLNTAYATAVSLWSSRNSILRGESVVFTVRVSDERGNPESGRVVFKANGTIFGAAGLDHGEARIETSVLPVGSDRIVAIYLGNADSQASRSEPLIQRVRRN
jgi:hypothetical protein